MTVSLFARSVARRAVQSGLRSKISPQVGGAVRFSSHYTPGTSVCGREKMKDL